MPCSRVGGTVTSATGASSAAAVAVPTIVPVVRGGNVGSAAGLVVGEAEGLGDAVGRPDGEGSGAASGAKVSGSSGVYSNVPLVGSPTRWPASVTTYSPGLLGHRPEVRSTMPRIAGSAPSTASTVTLSPRLPTRTSVHRLAIGTTRPPVRAPRADTASGRVDVEVRPGIGVAGFGAAAPEHGFDASLWPASQTPSMP